MKTPNRLLPGAAFVALLLCAFALPAAAPYREPGRPRFHFTPATNWMNDPNGMVFYDGEYHLFYQYNPFGNQWGHMSWGHAVSRDLMRWEHLPIALREENDVMVFSGSAVVDWKNTSGFGKNGKPPLVAIYTGHYTKQRLQNQHVAFSNDKGRTWTKFAGNPVLDVNMADFRDPKVFWHEPTARWVMTVALPLEKKVHFYTAPDLKHWKYVGEFGPAGATGGMWECPDLFPVAIEGGGTKWVLVVNLNPGGPAGGSGCQYFVGDFDGHRFSPDASFPKGKDAALWADFGPDFYAGVSWSDIPKSDGRRLWLGWMSNWQYANDVPTTPWRSAMSIPRELTLRQTGEGLRLSQAPVRELTKLRGPSRHFAGGTVAEANAWQQRNATKGPAFEWIVDFELPSQDGGDLKLLRVPGGGIVVGFNPEKGRLYLDRNGANEPNFHPQFPGQYSAPLHALDRRIKLHLFVDASSIEVLADDGALVLTALMFPSGANPTLGFLEDGKGLKIRGIDAWSLK